MRRLVVLLVAVVSILAWLPEDSRATGGPAYRVVVNAANPQAAVDRRFLSDAFLKKVTRWGAGEAIRPVDQRPDSAARQRFSDDVLGRSVAAVKSYWAQLVFSGRELPPPELEGDEEVVRYVAKHAGAVGYVSASSSLDLEGVKVVVVR
jgi:ABC-type phosphate transport system substrate-binding protein